MPDPVRPPADYGQVTLTGGRKLLQQLLSLIPALLLSWSLAALLLPLLGFSTALLTTPLLLLGFLLLLMLYTYNIWTTVIGSALLLGGLGAGLVALRRLASAAQQDLFPFLRDWLLLSAKPDLYPNLFMDLDSSTRTALAASGRQIFSLLLLFLVAMLAYFLAGRFRHPVWVLLILTALSTTALYLDQFAGLVWLTMGLVADLLLFLQSGHRGAHDRPRQKILRQRQLLLIGGLLSLLILLPVYFVLKDKLNQPEDSLYSREWFGTVDDFLDLLPESWTGSREFHAFSISSAGYYPLGDRLGGAVELNDNPVMTVSGQVTGSLLRGQISSNYTGSSWEYPSNIQTWRLNSPAYALLQSQVYEPSTSLLDKLKKSRYLTTNNYDITMLTDGYQVLFPALTPDDITLPVIRQDLVYFATDGVVYSQNRLPEGTTYSVSSSYINPDRLLSALTDAGLTVSALPDSARTDDNLAQNLAVPDSADYSEGGIVYDTARQAAGLTGDGSDDLDPLTQAINLRDYLQQMTYTLDAAAPAADEDFVAYFLQQQGYCVYFASAMTMMARSLGIPARYVEGYLASGLNSDDSVATITNRQAHAWSELYFDGIGWVSFDATPGASQDGDSQNNEDSLTPTPTPTPTPEAVTPTPTPTADPQQQTTPTPTATVTPPDQSDEHNGTGWVILLLILLLLVLAALLIWRWARAQIRLWTHLEDSGKALRLQQRPDTALARRLRRRFPTVNNTNRALALAYGSQILSLLNFLLPGEARHWSPLQWQEQLQQREAAAAEQPAGRAAGWSATDVREALRLVEKARYGNPETAALDADEFVSLAGIYRDLIRQGESRFGARRFLYLRLKDALTGKSQREAAAFFAAVRSEDRGNGQPTGVSDSSVAGSTRQAHTDAQAEQDSGSFNRPEDGSSPSGAGRDQDQTGSRQLPPDPPGGNDHDPKT